MRNDHTSGQIVQINRCPVPFLLEYPAVFRVPALWDYNRRGTMIGPVSGSDARDSGVFGVPTTPRTTERRMWTDVSVEVFPFQSSDFSWPESEKARRAP